MPRPLPPPVTADLPDDHPKILEMVAVLQRKPLTLKDYHELGTAMLDLSRDGDVAKKGSGWRKAAAGHVKCSEATLNKALQFRLAYEKVDDFKDLERLEVGWSRLTIALGVADRAERLKLLERADREGWNDRELQRAIQAKRGSRRGGGRPRRDVRSQGLVPDLAEFIRLTGEWLQFHDDVWATGGDKYARQVGRLKEPALERLRLDLAQAGRRLTDLCARVEDAKAILATLTAKAAEAAGEDEGATAG